MGQRSCEHRQFSSIWIFGARRYAISAALFIFLIAPAALFGAQPQIIAIADVHGDYDDFVALMQKTGLIDKDLHWASGNTTFVQVGDLLDRGPKPKEAMDLVMALEGEAQEAGGKVIPVLGNHEVMNMMGDLRYVVPENYAAYADGNSEERRKKAWEEFSKWRDKHKDLMAELPSFNVTEADWMAQHPAGFVEQREAFSPKGKYGKWLRSHPLVVKVDGYVFLHGGLNENFAQMGIDKINERIHDEMNVFDSTRRYLEGQQLTLPFFTLQEMTAVVKAQIHLEQKNGVPAPKQLETVIAPFMSFGRWTLIVTDSPIWFRGYSEWTDDEGNAAMPKILQSVDAKGIAVGHTFQPGGRVKVRFGGKAFLLDTGMLSSHYTGGRASALEIRNDGEIDAAYMDQVVVLQPAAGTAAAASSSKN